MSAKELGHLVDRARQLAPEEQLKLLAELSSLVRGEAAQRPRSIRELRGLGREIWDGVDAQEYVNRERATWNG